MVYYTTYVLFCQEKSNARSEHMFPVECSRDLSPEEEGKMCWVFRAGVQTPYYYII